MWQRAVPLRAVVDSRTPGQVDVAEPSAVAAHHALRIPQPRLTRTALPSLSPLPQLATKLAELIRVLQAVLNDLRAACEEIVHGSGRAKRSVDGSRRGLKAALAAHQEACR